MAENKKQHFVPRFLLKRFSNDNKRIGVYLKDKNRFIKHVSLADQCQKAYFYGNDLTLEKYFSNVEGTANTIINNIESGNIINRKNDLDDLYNFVIQFHYRTEKNVNEVFNTLNLSLKEAFKNTNEFNDLNISYEEPAAFVMSYFLNMNKKSFDGMDLIILKNDTDIPFIISDNPLVMYNQFMANRNSCLGKASMVSKGLQMIFPISPKYILFYYDKSVYKLKNKLKVENVTFSDVTFLNKLQFINSNICSYFNNDITEKHITLIDNMNGYKKNTYSKNLNEKIIDGNLTSITQEIVHGDICLKTTFSFIKYTNNVKKHKMSTNYSVITPRTKYIESLMKNKKGF